MTSTIAVVSPLAFPLFCAALVLGSPTLHAHESSASLNQIKRAEPKALELAFAKLGNGIKPDRALVDALQEALIVKPVEVLRTMSHPNHLRLVCGPSVQLTYDLAEYSLNERYGAVLTAHANSDNEVERKHLAECADRLDQADRQARRAQNAR